MISLEDCVALSGLTEGQDPPADQPIVQSLEPAACFVPYLLTTRLSLRRTLCSRQRSPRRADGNGSVSQAGTVEPQRCSFRTRL